MGMGMVTVMAAWGPVMVFDSDEGVVLELIMAGKRVQGACPAKYDGTTAVSSGYGVFGHGGGETVRSLDGLSSGAGNYYGFVGGTGAGRFTGVTTGLGRFYGYGHGFGYCYG
jgi:hypothetical protein